MDALKWGTKQKKKKQTQKNNPWRMSGYADTSTSDMDCNDDCSVAAAHSCHHLYPNSRCLCLSSDVLRVAFFEKALFLSHRISAIIFSRALVVEKKHYLIHFSTVTLIPSCSLFRYGSLNMQGWSVRICMCASECRREWATEADLNMATCSVTS